MYVYNLEIKAIIKSDYNSLCEFLSNFTNEKKENKKYWIDRLNYWWEQNPAFSENIIRGWVFKKKGSDTIVGFIGNIPTYFNLEGKKTIVYNATTWRVDQNYRNQSLILLSQYISYANKTILFDTSPSAIVEKILKSLKFKKFQTNNYKYCIYLNPINILENHLPFSGAPIKIISKLIKIYHSLFISSIKKAEKIKIITNHNTDFNTLWNRTKHIYPNTNVRNSIFIDWYCFNKLSTKKLVLGYYDNKSLIAYCIFNEIQGDTKTLSCLDLWGENIDKKIFKSFCQVAMQYGNNNGVSRIIFPYFNKNLDNIFMRLGLIKRKSYDKRYYKDSKNGPISINNNTTYLTYLNGDVGLL